MFALHSSDHHSFIAPSSTVSPPLAALLVWSCFRRFLGHVCRVTASASNETSSTEKFILRALVISLLLHLLAFSLYRVGQAQGWWQNMAMPRWMQLASKALMPMAPKKP